MLPATVDVPTASAASAAFATAVPTSSSHSNTEDQCQGEPAARCTSSTLPRGLDFPAAFAPEASSLTASIQRGFSSTQQISSTKGAPSRTREMSCASVRHPRDKTRRALALRSSVQTASAQSAPSARRLMEEEKEEVEEADAGAALGASCLGPPLLFLRVLLFLRRLPTVAQASSKGCSAPAGGGTGAALSVAPGAAGAAPSIPVPASKSAVSDGSSVDASSSAFGSELGAASRGGACSAPTTQTAGAVAAAALASASLSHSSAASRLCLSASAFSRALATRLCSDTTPLRSFLPLTPRSRSRRSFSSASLSALASERCRKASWCGVSVSAAAWDIGTRVSLF